MLTLNISITTLSAQEDDAEAISREQRVKAAYLYQFGRYVQWPAQAFSSADAPFVIGVLRQDPLVPHLDQVAQTKQIQKRSIQVRQFASDGDVPACHILFLSASLAPEVQATIIHKVAGKHTLLVGDIEKFFDLGGAVRFVLEDNNVRLHIARKAAEREGLAISAKLLQVAYVVD